MTALVHKVLHAVFSHPGHQHHYSYHLERDYAGNLRPFWRCVNVFCGEELEVTEWD